MGIKIFVVKILPIMVCSVITFSCLPKISPSTTQTKPPNPPIVITLDKVGVIRDHDIGVGDIYLYVAVSDGKGQPVAYRIPSSGYIYLNDNESKEVSQQLFSTGSVGDQLKIVAIAFESDSTICGVKSTVTTIFNALVPYLQGNIGTGATLINTLLSSQPSPEDGCPEGITAETSCDDFVGALERTWTSAEKWGVGSYSDITGGDLRLWFTISSPGQNQAVQPARSVPAPTSTPQTTPTPTPTPTPNPIPSSPSQQSPTPVPVPAPTPPPIPSTPTSLSVNFGGWSFDGAIVTAAIKGKTVTAKIILTGGNPGQYKIRIRRAVSTEADQTIIERNFSYNGTSISQEISFIPQYATAESYTQGYHIDVSKDGIMLWTQINAYPPRLKVSKQ